MHITAFSINNFRSLKGTEAENLSETVIFFGNNDTGKSNILVFLEILFNEKVGFEQIQSRGEEDATQVSVPFWRGIIEDFSGNFHRDNNEPITFSVSISFHHSELQAGLVKDYLEDKNNEDCNQLVISGSIRDGGPNHGIIEIINVNIDNENIFNDGPSDSERYLSGVELSTSDPISTFGDFMRNFSNLFLRIPANRYLKNEIEEPRGTFVSLKADKFKNWLFSLSLNPYTENIYQKIVRDFSSPPFNKGNVSLARVGQDEIEIFIEDDEGVKLPIGRKGTGVQQILILLAYIAQSESAILGIEEIEINLSPQTQRAIFATIQELIKSDMSNISQVFLSTHSRYIALNRADTERRIVSILHGETSVSEVDENLEGFFDPF